MDSQAISLVPLPIMTEEKTSQEVISSKQVDVSFCSIPIQIREESGEFYTEGWIYTTHMDRAREDGCENTMFSKRCMEQIADAINKGGSPITMLGSRRTVSIQHDWIKENDPHIEPIGMALPGAEVRQTDDGQWGVWGKTHYDKFHPKFEETKSRIMHGYYPGYSIEFVEGDFKKISIAGRMVKFIENIKEFLGYGLASARLIANPQAVITSFGYREVEEVLLSNESEKCKKCNKSEEECECEDDDNGNNKSEVREMTQESKTEVALEVQQREIITETIVPSIEAPQVREEAVIVPEVQIREEVKVDVDAIVAKVRESEDYKKAIDALQIKSRVLNTGKTEDGTMSDIKIRELNESMKNPTQFRMAAADYLDETGMISKAFAQVESTGFVGFRTSVKARVVGKGVKVGEISARSTLDTAGNTSPYTQQPVELADVFAPGLNDIFNNETKFFSFLGKESWNAAAYQWKNVTNRDPNSISSSVDRDDTTIIKNFSNKVNLQTPLKVYRRGVSVTDFIQRYAAQSLGDLFMREVELQMKEMMVDIEADLFAEVADGTGNAVLGLEAVADVTGNTTLYGVTRTTANQLTTGTLADTYVNHAGAITEAAIRTGIQKLADRGVRIENMAIVTSNKGKDYIFNLLDTNRRFNTTQAEFGFNQRAVPTYDSLPVITSWKCNSTLATATSATAAMYIIDTEQDKIIVGMEPRLINLAKVDATTNAYVETHIAHVYKDPRKIYMIDNFSTG